MAKISFGNQDGESKFDLDVTTHSESQTEIKVGDQSGASIRDVHIQDLPPEINMALLSEELSRMRLAAKDHTSPEARGGERALEAAEKTARAGDHAGTAKLLGQAGKWALDLAKTIGAQVAVSAIKKAIGVD